MLDTELKSVSKLLLTNKIANSKNAKIVHSDEYFKIVSNKAIDGFSAVFTPVAIIPINPNINITGITITEVIVNEVIKDLEFFTL